MAFPNTLELAALGFVQRPGVRRGNRVVRNQYPGMVTAAPLLFEETPEYVAYMQAKCERGSQEAICSKYLPQVALAGLGDGESEWLHTGDYIIAVQKSVDEMLDSNAKDTLQSSLDKVKDTHRQSGGVSGFLGIGKRDADFVAAPSVWAKEYKWMTDQLRAVERQANKATGRFAFMQGLGTLEDTMAAILEELRKIEQRFPDPQKGAAALPPPPGGAPIIPPAQSPAVQAMGDYIEGLGDSAWSNWYYTQYLPQYYAQQYAQTCPQGYVIQTQANGQRVCVPATQQAYQYAQPMNSYYTPGYGYGYTNPNYPSTGYSSGYGMTAQQCAGQGMMWDSFSGQCQSFQTGTTQATSGTAMPNVL